MFTLNALNAINAIRNSPASLDIPYNIMNRSIILLVAGLLSTASYTCAFSPSASFSSAVQIQRFEHTSATVITSSSSTSRSHMMSEDDDDNISSSINDRIQTLVESHSVLLFMKGSKLFPQCGFSNTACQILNSYNIDFMTVDVLADEGIRQGVKLYSQWPTIPQLYVCGEFIGGSDIMIELYQSG